MSFSDAALGAKYRSLGFVSDGPSSTLKIGDVELLAVEHPLNGVVIFFTHISPRTMAQFEISLPIRCSTEQIAGMIYANIAKICPDQAAAWKRHFQQLKVPLFQ